MKFTICLIRNEEVLKFYEKTRLQNFGPFPLKAKLIGIRDGLTSKNEQFYALEFVGNWLGYFVAKLVCRGKAHIFPFHLDDWIYKDES